MLEIHYPEAWSEFIVNSWFGELINKESVMKAAVSLFPIFSTQKSMTKNLILDDKSHPHY